MSGSSPVRFNWIVLIAVFALLTEAYWFAHGADGMAHLWVRVQADGLFLRGPHGGIALVDGPADADHANTWVSAHLPPGRWSLDALFLTIPDGEVTLAQVAVAQRYPPRQGWCVDMSARLPTLVAWRDAVRHVRPLQVGASVVVDGVEFTLLHQRPPVLKVRYGHLRILYVPRGLPDGLAGVWSQATLGVVRTLPRTNRAYPPYVLLADVEALREAADVLLAHPRTRVLIPPTPYRVLHVRTDGRRWAFHFVDE